MFLCLLVASVVSSQMYCIEVGDDTTEMCDKLERDYNKTSTFRIRSMSLEEFQKYDFQDINGDTSLSNLIMATTVALETPLSLAKFQPSSGRVNITLAANLTLDSGVTEVVPMNIDWKSLQSKVDVLHLRCGATKDPLPMFDIQGISFGWEWKQGTYTEDFDLSKIPYVQIETTDAPSPLEPILRDKKLQTAVICGSDESLGVGENRVYMRTRKGTELLDPVHADNLFLNLGSDVLDLYGEWPTGKLTIRAPKLMRLDVTKMNGTGAIVVFTEAVPTDWSDSFQLKLPTDTPVNVVVSSTNLDVGIEGGGPTLTFTEPFTVSGELTFPETATSVTIEDITMTAGASIIWNPKKAATLADSGLTIQAVTIAGEGCRIIGASVGLITMNHDSSVSLSGATAVSNVEFECDVKSSSTGLVLVSATQAKAPAPKARIAVSEKPSTIEPLTLFVLNDTGSFSAGWENVLEDDEYFSSYIATTDDGKSAVFAKKDKKGLGPGPIAGIVIGCVAVVAIIAVIAVVCIRRKKDVGTSSEGQNETASDKE